jgi:two-component system chemotaxis response regulator CheY
MADKFRVLSVDDDPAMRAHLRANLESAGIVLPDEDFVEAGDGCEGYRTLARLHFTGRDALLVVSDWEMPKMSGLDLLRRVRSDLRFKQVPFLLATGVSQQGAVVDAIKAGVSNYVVKPYEFEAFKPKLDTILPKIEVYRKFVNENHITPFLQRRWLIVDNIGSNRLEMSNALRALGFTNIVEAAGVNDAMAAVTRYRSEGSFFGILCDPNLRGDQHKGLIAYCQSEDRRDTRAFFLAATPKELVGNELQLVAEGIDGEFALPIKMEEFSKAIGAPYNPP